MAAVNEKKPEESNNNVDVTAAFEEEEKRKQFELINKIQAERAEMRKFLVMKSTEQQRREGVEHPVDTAFIDSEDGKLTLKAVFDVHLFKPDEIDVQIIDNQLVMNAQCMDDQENALYRKTMLRRIDLPETADTNSVNCVMSEEGILTISMPFHLPPPKQSTTPPVPTAVPIISENGRRFIRLQFFIGPDFTMDDVKVNSEGQALYVKASYEAEVGLQGAQVTRRELKREFRLPENIEVDTVKYELTEDGVLQIEILLSEAGQHYRCHVLDTEDVTGKV